MPKFTPTKQIELRWPRIRAMMGAMRMTLDDVSREWRDGRLNTTTLYWLLNDERIQVFTAELEMWLDVRAGGKQKKPTEDLEARWTRIRSLMGALRLKQTDLVRDWMLNGTSVPRMTIQWILNDERIMADTADLEEWLDARMNKAFPKGRPF